MHVLFKQRQGEGLSVAFVPEKVTAPLSPGSLPMLWSCGISVYIILLPAPEYLSRTPSISLEFFVVETVWCIAKAGSQSSCFSVVSGRDYRCDILKVSSNYLWNEVDYNGGMF